MPCISERYVVTLYDYGVDAVSMAAMLSPSQCKFFGAANLLQPFVGTRPRSSMSIGDSEVVAASGDGVPGDIDDIDGEPLVGDDLLASF